MVEPLISVIVPVFNTEKYLSRCIESIVSQTYKNLEIIIVDDGSTDKSGALADSIGKTDNRIKVIHKKNGGLSSARNAGITRATGNYIGFVDSDDCIESDMYKKLLDAIEEYQCTIAVCGRHDVFEDDRIKRVGLCPVKKMLISGKEAVGNILIWDQMDSSACDKLFSAHVFKKYKFPEGQLSEDVAIMYKIMLDAANIILIPACLYNYYHRSNSITTSKSFNVNRLHIDNHSKEILNYVSSSCPELIEKAIYFRCSILLYLYDLLIDAGKYKEKEYINKIYDYSSELRQNWNIYTKYGKSHESIKSKLKKRLMLYPSLYLYIKIVWRIIRKRG